MGEQPKRTLLIREKDGKRRSGLGLDDPNNVI